MRAPRALRPAPTASCSSKPSTSGPSWCNKSSPPSSSKPMSRSSRPPIRWQKPRSIFLPSVANPKFAIPRGSSAIEFRIQSHTSNLLILVWFSNLKFLNADAMLILGTFKFTTLARLRHNPDIGLGRLPSLGIGLLGVVVRDRARDDHVLALLPIHRRGN